MFYPLLSMKMYLRAITCNSLYGVNDCAYFPMIPSVLMWYGGLEHSSK